MKVLQVVGGAAIAYTLLTKLAYGVANRFEYELLPLKLSNFRFRVREWEPIGVLKVYVKIRNNTPLNLAAQSLHLQLSQQGEPLGNVLTSNVIDLPSGEDKTLAVDVEIDSLDFLDRVKALVEGEGGATWYAPIDIRGVLQFTNGNALPIYRKLEFFTVT